MIDFTLILLILIITIPLLMVFFTLVSKPEHHAQITLAGLGLIMLGLVVLVFRGEGDVVPGWRFMGELIIFSVSNTAIWLYMAVLLGLVSLIWRERQGADKSMTPYQWTLLNLSLSAGCVAFFSGQFMIRYIALDVVGLLAALTLLSTFSATAGLRHFIIVFQILRLGDLALLAAILLLNHLTGTLEISSMIAGAVDLPTNTRMWIIAGFILALLIKLAIWPFGVWLEKARQSAPRISFWISGLLLPGLGYYLLYRVIPILQSGSIFQNLLLSAALVLGVLICLLTALQAIKFDRFTQVSGLMGGFLLAAAALEGGRFLMYYLVGLVVHRMLLLFAEDRELAHLTMLSALFPVLINGVFIVLNLNTYPLAFSIGWSVATALMVVWDYFMQRQAELSDSAAVVRENDLLSDQSYGGFLISAANWLNRTLELGILTHGVARMSEFFHRIADWFYDNIEMGLDYLWLWVGRKLVQVSEGALRKVEVDAAQRSGDLMDEALNSLERYEETLARKTLRWDLAWIPFLLVVILIMLFVL